MTNKINTSGKRFNEIKHLVKAIPTSKTYQEGTYRRLTTSFSMVAQNTAAKTARKAGMKARICTYKRAGRKVYTVYVR